MMCNRRPISIMQLFFYSIQWANSLPRWDPQSEKRNWVHRWTLCIPAIPSVTERELPGLAICNQSWPDQGQVSQNKSLHMFSIVLVPRAHEEKGEGFWGFPSIETVELQNHTRITFFAPRSHCRSEGCEMRDEAWWRIRRGASYWRPRHKWK